MRRERSVAGGRRRREETGAEEQANQRGAEVSRQIRHHFYAADRFIAVGLLLGFATLAEQIFVLENAHPNASLVALIGYMNIQQRDVYLPEHLNRL